MKKIKTPLDEKLISSLKASDELYLSGVIYTARDQAHKKLKRLISTHKKLPFNLKNQVIYYCGPTETPKGYVIGSCGPTTSSRMDDFVKPLLENGLLGMIGKGRRNDSVRKLIKKHKVVYFLAPSGCGALLAKHVIKKVVIGFSELGPEAICELTVKDFPLIVGIDSKGKSLFKY